MGKQPIIGFSRRQDFEDTAKTVADDKRRDMAGQAGGRNTMAPPHLRWGKVVSAWADGDLNSVTVRPCFADGTAIAGIKTDGTHDLKIYIVWPPTTDPGNMTELLPAGTLLPWLPFGVPVNTDFYGLSYLNLATETVTPGSFDTIGVNTEGAEGAASDTWDVTTTDNGLDLYVMGRNAYYHAGDEKFYGYTRKLRFDATGRLLSVSAETRIEIDVPVVCGGA